MQTFFIGAHIGEKKTNIESSIMSKEIDQFGFFMNYPLDEVTATFLERTMLNVIPESLEKYRIKKFGNTDYYYLYNVFSFNKKEILDTIKTKIESFIKNDYSSVLNPDGVVNHSKDSDVFIDVFNNIVIVRGKENVKNLIYFLSTCIGEVVNKSDVDSISEMKDLGMEKLIKLSYPIFDDFISIFNDRTSKNVLVQNRHIKRNK